MKTTRTRTASIDELRFYLVRPEEMAQQSDPFTMSDEDFILESAWQHKAYTFTEFEDLFNRKNLTKSHYLRIRKRRPRLVM